MAGFAGLSKLVGPEARGAGILFARRDARGRPCVLLGRKPEAGSKWAAVAAAAGYRWTGWTVPFGTMDDADGGDFRRCAVREAAQEALGLGDHAPYGRCLAELDAAPGSGESVAATVARQEGFAWTFRPLGMEYRTYFVPVPPSAAFEPRPNWEFEPGTLGWVPHDEAVGREPQHFLLRPLLRHYHVSVVGV